ncbi:hypothetical protein BOX15_Mlig019738g2 [Macrostomum lignano]|nr:hypothetical protein BOX15_Mlig019738g2 [Macrostomum lignano]
MSSPFIPCLLDLQKHLSDKEFICDWKLHTCLPAPQSAIADWENRNCCQLPPDLKTFYHTSDGVHFSYSAKCGEIKSKIGNFRVNSLDNLRPIVGGHCDLGQERPSLADVDADFDAAGVSLTSATRGNCRIFELETLDWPGHVCLVLHAGNRAGVYLLDRAMRFHLLANCFQDYYTLALAHRGLLQWQLCLTDIGPTPGAREWLSLLAPLRLQLDSEVDWDDSNLLLGVADLPSGFEQQQQQQQSISNVECGFDRERVFRGKPASSAAAPAGGAGGAGEKKRGGGGGGGRGGTAAPSPGVRRFASTTKAAMAKSAAPMGKK